MGGAEGVDRGPATPQLGDQGVLGGQDVGHLVLDRLPVGRSHQVHQQALGSPGPEGLDGQQHPDLVRRVGCAGLVGCRHAAMLAVVDKP